MSNPRASDPAPTTLGPRPHPPSRTSLRRRWRRARQHPYFQHRALRSAQLTALAALLVVTGVLVYRAITVV